MMRKEYYNYSADGRWLSMDAAHVTNGNCDIVLGNNNIQPGKVAESFGNTRQKNAPAMILENK